jgi:hypothetical protein
MRRALIAVALMALVVPASASASARLRTRCATRGTTVSANSVVRVYRTGTVDDRSFTGCVTRTGRSRYLAFEGGGGSHAYGLFFRLAGARVAFVQMDCLGGSSCRYDARTVDLRTGKSIRRVLNRQGEPLDMQITRSGSFALLLYFGGPVEEIATVEADGMHSLDSGSDMDEHSLAIGGSHVYWTRAGEAHSAPIR